VRISTTGKQQSGCEHYWHTRDAGIHYWQASEGLRALLT